MSKSCQYDPTFQCIIDGNCPYPELLSCLKISYSELKHRQMLRHNKASLKWRNSSFYYKAKCKALLARVERGRGK